MIRYSRSNIFNILSIFLIFIILFLVLLLIKYNNNNEYFSTKNKKNKKNKKIVGLYGINSLDLNKPNLWKILGLKYGEDMASKVLSGEHTEPFLFDGNILNLKTYIQIVSRNNNIDFFLHKIIKCVYKKINKPDNKNKFNLQLFPAKNTENIIVDPSLPYRIEDLYNSLQYKHKIPFYKISKLKFDIKRNLKLVAFALKNKIINNNKNKSNRQTTKYDLLEIDLLIDNGLYPYILEINKVNKKELKSNNNQFIPLF